MFRLKSRGTAKVMAISVSAARRNGFNGMGEGATSRPFL